MGSLKSRPTKLISAYWQNAFLAMLIDKISNDAYQQMHFAYDERNIDQNAYAAVEHDRYQKEL